MATKKNFLRVTGSWSELFSPSDYDNYISDLSGTPALIYISDKKLDPTTITNGWFTLGGNISQMRLMSDKYIYAKAALDDPAGFITIVQAHEHMPVSDVEDVRDQMNDIIEQVMHMAGRLTKNTIAIADHAVEYELLLRAIAKQNAANAKKFGEIDDEIADIHNTQNIHRQEYLNFFDAFAHTNAVIDNHLTTLDFSVVDLWNKLYSAETLLLKYRADYKMLNTAIKNLEINGVGGGIDAGSASLILSELASFATQMNNINDSLSSLSTRTAALERNVGSGQGADSETVTKLNKQFADVNNTLTRLADIENPEDVETVFQALVPTVDTDMRVVVEAIKNIILRTANVDSMLANGEIVTTDGVWEINPENIDLTKVSKN